MEFIRSVLSLYIERSDWFLSLLADHIRLSATAIGIAGIIGFTIGVIISEKRRFASVIIGICNMCYTVPAISMLGLLIPFLGIGNTTAITALSIYAIMPMVRNTYTGLTTIDEDIIEAARGMGSTDLQIMLRVKVPLALVTILSGIRQMTVMTISMAGIASFVGASGLGVAVFRGISVFNPAMTFAGGLLIALLAIVSDNLLGLLERILKKR